MILPFHDYQPTPDDWEEYQNWLDSQPPEEILDECEFETFVNFKFDAAAEGEPIYLDAEDYRTAEPQTAAY